MKLEDYSEYYIQGSDHYLIPKAIFIELYEEMANFREEKRELESQLKGTTHCFDEEEHEQLRQENQKLRIQVSSREEVANKYKEVIYKAKELINKCVELQLENDYLMDRINLANYNMKLLDILKEVK